MASPEIVNELLNGLRERLKSRWKECRKQSFSPNTKGAAYEKALANFLKDYIGGVYNIHTRTAIIDDELKCFDLFSIEENEFDIVATYKQSKPQIIFEAESMKWVPYNAVPFICEVKSSLSTSNLRSDLEKTTKLSKIEREGGFGVTIGGNMTVDYQLKFLVYDEAPSIDMKTVYDILEENMEGWELVLLVEDDELIANPRLPFSKILSDFAPKKTDSGIVHSSNGLIWFLTYISVSIVHPPAITTVRPILNMMNYEFFSILRNYIKKSSNFEELQEQLSEEGLKVDKETLKEVANEFEEVEEKIHKMTDKE